MRQTTIEIAFLIFSSIAEISPLVAMITLTVRLILNATIDRRDKKIKIFISIIVLTIIMSILITVTILLEMTVDDANGFLRRNTNLMTFKSKWSTVQSWPKNWLIRWNSSSAGRTELSGYVSEISNTIISNT